MSKQALIFFWRATGRERNGKNSNALPGYTQQSSTQLPLHQLFRIPDIDLPPRGIVDVEPVDHRDGGGDRPERRVGREHDVLGAEEIETARDAVFAAEHGGVA